MSELDRLKPSETMNFPIEVNFFDGDTRELVKVAVANTREELVESVDRFDKWDDRCTFFWTDATGKDIRRNDIVGWIKNGECKRSYGLPA